MFLLNQVDFKKILRVIFHVFIVVFPFLIYQGFIFNGTSTRSLNLIILMEILAVSFGFLLFKDDTKVSIPKSPITISLLILLISLFASSILGVDFATSFWSKVTRSTGLFYLIHLGLFYTFFVLLFKEESFLRRFIKIFLISAAVFSIGSVLSKDGFGLIFANREWSGFTFGNSTFAAMYLFSAFVMSFYYVFSLDKISRKWWYYLIPFLFVVNPYFLNFDLIISDSAKFESIFSLIGSAQASFGALVASSLMLLVTYIISRVKSLNIQKKLVWASVVGVLIVLFAVVGSLLTPGGAVQNLYKERASAARPIVWELSKKAIAEKPIFGWGVDNFSVAYERYYDNAVMEKVNGFEAWFDRAHNIFIDQAVETGYLGVSIYILVFLTIIGSMLYVILKSKDNKDRLLASVIIIYFFSHILELQTAFETTISYVPVTIFAAVGTIVFYRTYNSLNEGKGEINLSKYFNYIFGFALISLSFWVFFVGTYPILKTEISNGYIRRIGSSDGRLPKYDVIFGSPLDKAGFLNRTFTDLQAGISVDPSILEKPGRIEGFKKELEVFAKEYEEYIFENPNDYRARIKLTDLYIYQRLFEVDNLNLAIENADESIKLVPQAPQSYWQKSVAYLYERKFDLAREWAKKAYDLNPNIEESQRLLKYIEDSIKTFPEIDLYAFKQL